MSNHFSTRNQVSNHSAVQHTAQQAYDISDIRYFVRGFVLHQKSQRQSDSTIVFYTDRLGRLVWFLQAEGAQLREQHVISRLVLGVIFKHRPLEVLDRVHLAVGVAPLLHLRRDG